jgi:hypothetical protein
MMDLTVRNGSLGTRWLKLVSLLWLLLLVLCFASRAGAADYDAHLSWSTGCTWYTWIDRGAFNLNHHHAQSRGGQDAALCPITRMEMRVRAWKNGAIQYDNTFGFNNASSLYARNYGYAPGSAQSDATYTNGTEVYRVTVSKSY